MAKVTVAECIDILSDHREDMAYKIKRARSPQQKRNAQRTADFFAALVEHLENYQKTLS